MYILSRIVRHYEKYGLSLQHCVSDNSENSRKEVGSIYTEVAGVVVQQAGRSNSHRWKEDENSWAGWLNQPALNNKIASAKETENHKENRPYEEKSVTLQLITSKD